MTVTEQEIEAMGDEAIDVVEAFISKHHAGAIPALIGACAMWSVEHGAAELFKASLGNLINATTAMAEIRNKEAQ